MRFKLIYEFLICLSTLSPRATLPRPRPLLSETVMAYLCTCCEVVIGHRGGTLCCHVRALPLCCNVQTVCWWLASTLPWASVDCDIGPNRSVAIALPECLSFADPRRVYASLLLPLPSLCAAIVYAITASCPARFVAKPCVVLDLLSGSLLICRSCDCLTSPCDLIRDHESTGLF
jgi:hypothetical protein